jgi:serine/threonine-protein kinase
MSELRRAAVRALLPTVTIGDVIGSGAGGWVLAGWDRTSGGGVAVKVLADELWLDGLARSRIRTEAEILTSCRHPHVIRGFAFHELADMSVLLMERVDGETVLDRNSRSRMPIAEARRILLAVAAALQHVHERGFLHGDVKPENVLFDAAGGHKLIDFGLARRWPCPVQRQVAGTPWYMAPEAIRAGGALLPATDVYALGMMAYELFAGHLPFPPADGPVGIMRQQLDADPMPLAVAVPRLPRALTALVMAAIEKRIEDRVASASEFADCLMQIDVGSLTEPGALTATNVDHAGQDFSVNAAARPEAGQKQ